MPAGYRVLEVGCGTGNTLRVLERVCEGGTVIGTDPFDEGLQIARRRVSCDLVQSDIRNLRVPGEFAVIGAFDVLEHVADDLESLRDLRLRLRPEGRLLVTVPAHMELWSYADEAAHHYRRYSSRQLQQTLETAGYIVEYLTPFMSLIYPVMWLARRFATWRAGSAAHDKAFEMTLRELRIVPGWNEVLSWALALELPLFRARISIPFGTSLLAIARRGD